MMSRSFSVLIVVVAALATACAKHEPPPTPVRPVQLTQVRVAAIGATAVFAGEVKPRHEIDLGFRIGGKVIGRSVDVGSRVTRGQSLARLDPIDVGLQADAQAAAVVAAETEYRYARAEFDRYENLFKQKFISASALDQKRSALDGSRAKLDQAKAQLAVTRNQTAYATLTAPESGVITAMNIEGGQVVTAGQTVMRLAREDEREVSIAVPESRIDELRRAPKLGVFLWANPQKIYPARVREIAPAVDPITRTFAIRVSLLEADAALQWGMTANVVLVNNDAPAAVVPLTAIYRKGDDAAVWVYDPTSRSVTLRPIGVAQYREDGVVVKDGLRDGDWIVTAGVHKLREGEMVRPYDHPKV